MIYRSLGLESNHHRQCCTGGLHRCHCGDESVLGGGIDARFDQGSDTRRFILPRAGCADHSKTGIGIRTLPASAEQGRGGYEARDEGPRTLLSETRFPGCGAGRGPRRLCLVSSKTGEPVDVAERIHSYIPTGKLSVLRIALHRVIMLL